MSETETDHQWAERMVEKLFHQIVERDGVRLQFERDGTPIPRDEDRVALWKELLDELDPNKMALLKRLLHCRCPKCGNPLKQTKINKGVIRHRCSNCKHVFPHSEALKLATAKEFAEANQESMKPIEQAVEQALQAITAGIDIDYNWPTPEACVSCAVRPAHHPWFLEEEW